MGLSDWLTVVTNVIMNIEDCLDLPVMYTRPDFRLETGSDKQKRSSFCPRLPSMPLFLDVYNILNTSFCTLEWTFNSIAQVLALSYLDSCSYCKCLWFNCGTYFSIFIFNFTFFPPSISGLWTQIPHLSPHPNVCGQWRDGRGEQRRRSRPQGWETLRSGRGRSSPAQKGKTFEGRSNSSVKLWVDRVS